MAITSRIFLTQELDTSTNPYIIANSNTYIAGSSANDSISINSGILGIEIASTIEKVGLNDNLGDGNLTFRHGFGSNLEVHTSDGNLITTITDVNGKTLQVGDGTLSLSYDSATDKVKVEGAIVSDSTGAISITHTIADAPGLNSDNSVVSDDTYSFTIEDTSANINSNLATLLADNDVKAIDSIEDNVAINITATTNLAKLQESDTIVVVDTGANIATLVNDSANNPIDAKIDRVDANDDSLTLTYTEFGNVTNAKLTASDSITITDIVDGTNFSTADISNIDTITPTSGANITLTNSQFNALVINDGGGTETITFSDATTSTAKNDIEQYILANATNSFTANSTTTSITGGTGNDTFIMGTNMDSGVIINGGAGNDEISMTDQTGNTNDLDNVTNVEKITLGAADTSITTVDTLVASGANIFIDGSNATTLTLDGSNESNGTFNIIGSAEDDNITGGDGNDIIRGGAGADTISGGAGDDTFVVLGVIGADDYAASDVTSGTGAYALGLANLIDTGLSNSDSGTDGTGETYDGGEGTNVIEIWGDADLTNATITNIDAINTHSTLNIKDTQLASLFSGNGAAVDLNLLSDDSTINIIGSGTAADGHEIISTDTGLAILTYFKTGIDPNYASNDTFNPNISFWMDALDDGVAVQYSIQKEDVIPTVDTTNGNFTYTDDADENSVITVVANPTENSTTTIDAGTAKDIVVMDIGAMDSSVTVDGGDDQDILVYVDTNGDVDDLDHVSNMEIVYFLDNVPYNSATVSGATVTTVDSLVAADTTLVVAAEDLSAGGLTWNGAAETDGSFIVWASNQADTLTGGAKDDVFNYVTDIDTIDGGDNNTVDRANNINGDTALFAGTVLSDNLTDDHLQNIETIVVTDIGTDATETYDFSAQTEDLFITVQAGKDTDGSDITSGVTIVGGSGNDTINLGAGADIVTFAGGFDTLVGFATGTDKLNVDHLLTDGDVSGSDFATFDGTATATDNNIVNFTSSAALGADDVAAKFEATDSDDSLMVLASGDQIIFINQDDDSTDDSTNADFGAQIFVVNSTDAGISATLVGTSYSDADSTSLAFGDFV